MIIIGFSTTTSKILPRVLCGKFKHCVIITKYAGNFILHQFVKRKHICRITITERGLAQLESNGWVFIYKKSPISPQFDPNAWTCVDYVKRALGLHKIWIQTPNDLFKYIQKNLT